MVCVHGMGGSGSEFAACADYARKRGWQVETPDLPGHGARQDEGFGGVRFETYVREIEQIVLKMRSPIVLVGHSMGGTIALSVAARQSKLISKVILLSSAPPRGILAISPNVLKVMWRYMPAILLGRPFRPTDEDLRALWLNNVPGESHAPILAGFGPESGIVARENIVGIPIDDIKIQARILVVAGTYDLTLPISIQRKIAKRYKVKDEHVWIVPHAHAMLHEEGFVQKRFSRILEWASS